MRYPFLSSFARIVPLIVLSALVWHILKVAAVVLLRDPSTQEPGIFVRALSSSMGWALTCLLAQTLFQVAWPHTFSLTRSKGLSKRNLDPSISASASFSADDSTVQSLTSGTTSSVPRDRDIVVQPQLRFSLPRPTTSGSLSRSPVPPDRVIKMEPLPTITSAISHCVESQGDVPTQGQGHSPPLVGATSKDSVIAPLHMTSKPRFEPMLKDISTALNSGGGSSHLWSTAPSSPLVSACPSRTLSREASGEEPTEPPSSVLNGRRVSAPVGAAAKQVQHQPVVSMMESTLPRNQKPGFIAVTSMSRCPFATDNQCVSTTPATPPPSSPSSQHWFSNSSWNPFVTAWIAFTLVASVTRVILESVWWWSNPLLDHQTIFRRCEAFSLVILVILACHAFRLYGILSRPNSWSALKRTYLWVPLTAVWLFRAASTLKWPAAAERLLLSIVLTQVWFVVVLMVHTMRSGSGTARELKRHLDLVMVFFCGYFVFGALEQGVTELLGRFLNSETQQQQSAVTEVFVTLTSRILMSSYIIISELSIGIVFGKQDLWLVFGHRLLEAMTVTSIALNNVTSTNALILHGFSNLLIVLVRDSGILEDLVFCFNHRLTLGDIYAIPDGHNPIIHRTNNQQEESRLHALFRHGGLLHVFMSLRIQLSTAGANDSGSFGGSTSVSQDDLSDDAAKSGKSVSGFAVPSSTSRVSATAFLSPSNRASGLVLPPTSSSSTGNSRISLPRQSAVAQGQDELSAWIGSLPRAYPSIGRAGTLDRRRRANVTLERRGNGTLERRQGGNENIKGAHEVPAADALPALTAEGACTPTTLDSSSGTAVDNNSPSGQGPQGSDARASSRHAASSVPLLQSWHRSLQLQVDRMQHSLIVRVATVLSFALCELLDRSIGDKWVLTSERDWQLSNFRLHLIGLFTITANVSVCMVYLVLSSKVEAVNELNRLATRNLWLESQSRSGSTASTSSESPSFSTASSHDSMQSQSLADGDQNPVRGPVIVTTLLESQSLPQTIVSITRKGKKDVGVTSALVAIDRLGGPASTALLEPASAVDARQTSRGTMSSVTTRASASAAKMSLARKPNAPILPLIRFWQINSSESTSWRQLVVACLVCTFFRFAEVYTS